MSSSCLSKVIIGVVILTTSRLSHGESKPVTLADGPYLKLTAENKAADLELGISFHPSSNVHIRPYVRVPFADTDTQLVRVDESSDALKAGIGLDYRSDWTRVSATSRSLIVSTELEFGTKSYRFTPLVSTDAQKRRHQSFSTSLQLRYAQLEASPDDRAVQFAPQLALTYNRTYSAADAVGVVMPGSNGAPSTVAMVTVDAPSVRPTLTARVGTPFYDAKLKAPVAFGAYIVSSLSGDRYTPWGDGQMVRGELWTYLFLTQPANTRAGLALFAESSRPSTDASTTTSYGLFVQLKLNTNLFDY